MTPEAEEWLAFQVATTYGLDKAPMSERLEGSNNTKDSSQRLHKIPSHSYQNGKLLKNLGSFLLLVMSTISVSLVVNRQLHACLLLPMRLALVSRSWLVYANARLQQDL